MANRSGKHAFAPTLKPRPPTFMSKSVFESRGGVAQWQSKRFIPVGSVVQIHSPLPIWPSVEQPMPLVRVETFIEAPREVCFDLARDIDVHQQTTQGTSERAVAGVTSGKMELGDSVTFEAKHFGVRQRLTSEIVRFERPSIFVDQMTKGAFKRMAHEHRFEAEGTSTRMVDVLDFESPLGPLGWLVDTLVLKRYMARFLADRGQALKRIAESIG